ncbi:hypothetical protein CAOG_009839 [Capsaspora owczarzaki ATCC 30864]|uniref:Secreted protein n=1 Tax=Capsaspora owczarzaki (strain ATCC 30864) TaxID=595528 RepID=A0A0D2UHW3_CAPO3|nr:hypothetical protein CAOG_009839 [Capsaspora owczarzaki ATCC 30864]
MPAPRHCLLPACPANALALLTIRLPLTTYHGVLNCDRLLWVARSRFCVVFTVGFDDATCNDAVLGAVTVARRL